MDAISSLRDTLSAHSQQGHFIYESGHHGDLWLELEGLLGSDDRMTLWAQELAHRAQAFSPEVVCGPQTGGARLAERVAAKLNAIFVYTQRDETQTDPPVRYRLPDAMRASVAGRRVLLIDDAINAGSAVSASHAELTSYGGEVVAIGCLLTLNQRPKQLADRLGLPLISLLQLEQSLWAPADCPICNRRQMQ